jgi:fibro-slime domain-containing protein
MRLVVCVALCAAAIVGSASVARADGALRGEYFFDPFFPDGKKADGAENGYRTVHWSGTFVQPQAGSVGFQLGSDDDSWVFVDGVLVVDNGGVKPEADAPYTVTHLATGAHRFDVFFADRHGSGACANPIAHEPRHS